MKQTTHTDKVFYATVRVLENAAKFINPYIPGGINYNKINVWLMYVAFASVALNIAFVIMLAWLLAHR